MMSEEEALTFASSSLVFNFHTSCQHKVVLFYSLQLRIKP